MSNSDSESILERIREKQKQRSTDNLAMARLFLEGKHEEAREKYGDEYDKMRPHFAYQQDCLRKHD